MKKIVIPVILLIALYACNQLNTNGNQNVTQGGDTVSNVNISISKVDALSNLAEEDPQNNNPILLFTAHGSEPGWYAQFYNNHLKLVVDYGKDSLLIDDVFENLNDAKGYTYSKAKNEHEEKYALSISIANTPCIYSSSGDKEDRTVTVKLNNKTYKGCGSFTK